MNHAAPLALTLMLGACATTADFAGPPLPTLKYATAGSYMDARTAFTAPPSPEIFEMSVRNWSDALADASACRLPPGEVTSATLVAAVELASMSAFAKAGDPNASVGDMARYAADMALAAQAEGRYPSRSRCNRIYNWLPHVNREGGDAVRRATINGLRRGLFGNRSDRP